MNPLKSLVHDANFTPKWAIQQQRSSRLTASACGPGLDALALANLDGRLVVDGRGTHSLLDLSGHGQESLLDVGSALGGSLEERNSEAVGKFLQEPFSQSTVMLDYYPRSTERTVIFRYREGGGTNLGDRVLHDLLVLHITLVANKELVDTLGSVAVDLLQPLLDVVEGVHIRHIVNDADAVGATVVRGGDGSETLLTGGIPLYKC